MDYFRSATTWILDLIFPIRCLGCGAFSAPGKETYLCAPCIRTIPIKHALECVGCKRAVAAGHTCILCRKEYSLDQLLIASDLRHRLVERILKTFKYRFVPALAEPIGQVMRKYLAAAQKQKKLDLFAANPMIIPIPLHIRRLNWRGFNQAVLLAKHMADRFQMQYCDDALKRNKYASPQAGIESRPERFKNIENQFICTNPHAVRDRHIIIVDDICTSGATLNACAAALKENGARKVSAFVVARG